MWGIILQLHLQAIIDVLWQYTTAPRKTVSEAFTLPPSLCPTQLFGNAIVSHSSIENPFAGQSLQMLQYLRNEVFSSTKFSIPLPSIEFRVPEFQRPSGPLLGEGIMQAILHVTVLTDVQYV